MTTKRRRSVSAVKWFKNPSGSNAVMKASAEAQGGTTWSVQVLKLSLRRFKTSNFFAVCAGGTKMIKKVSLPTRSSSPIDLHNIILQIIKGDRTRLRPTHRKPPSRRNRGSLDLSHPPLHNFLLERWAILQTLLILVLRFIWCLALGRLLVDWREWGRLPIWRGIEGLHPDYRTRLRVLAIRRVAWTAGAEGWALEGLKIHCLPLFP